jgi:hypothetical protein
MRLILLSTFGLLIFAVFQSQQIYSQDNMPMITYQRTITLPQKMQKALEEYNPNFKPWDISDYLPDVVHDYRFTSRQALSAVIGDFNSDRVTDVVMDGHNDHYNLLICILSDTSNYRIIEISKISYQNPKTIRYDDQFGIWNYLEFIGNQTLSSPFEPDPVKMQGDGIIVSAWRKASQVLYYKDGKFHSYVTGD